MYNVSPPPRWMRKESVKFAAKVAHFSRMFWAVTTIRRSFDLHEAQYHVGSGNKPSAALNSLAKDLDWWGRFEKRLRGHNEG